MEPQPRLSGQSEFFYAGERISRRELMKRSTGALLAVSGLPVLIAACGGDDGGSPGSIGPPEDFAFVPYQGVGSPEDEQEMMFSDVFQEGRPVILNFWAGQCPPCRAEMPHFQQLAEEYGDEIFLLGIDVGVFTMLGTQDDARALLKELEITYPTGYAVDRDPLLDYEVTAMPTTIFFTPTGEISDKRAGLILEDEMRQKIEAVLDSS
jgi:thiol-disulfide isomerase/thioredoxin